MKNIKALLCEYLPEIWFYTALAILASITFALISSAPTGRTVPTAEQIIGK